MQQAEVLAHIAQDFSDVIAALSPRESQSNRKLPAKTKRVAMLLGKAAMTKKQTPELNESAAAVWGRQ